MLNYRESTRNVKETFIYTEHSRNVRKCKGNMLIQEAPKISRKHNFIDEIPDV